MSYGEDLLRQYLALMVPHPFIQNYRPEWLYGMELDFFFPDKAVAIEFQGDHHYIETGYCRNISRVAFYDSRKREICNSNRVRLIRIDAVDLEYTRLACKLKGTKKFRSKNLIRFNVGQLRKLNAAAVEYRRNLVKSFDSVSARRKGTSRRAAIMRHDESSS